MDEAEILSDIEHYVVSEQIAMIELEAATTMLRAMEREVGKFQTNLNGYTAAREQLEQQLRVLRGE